MNIYRYIYVCININAAFIYMTFHIFQVLTVTFKDIYRSTEDKVMDFIVSDTSFFSLETSIYCLFLSSLTSNGF